MKYRQYEAGRLVQTISPSDIPKASSDREGRSSLARCAVIFLATSSILFVICCMLTWQTFSWNPNVWIANAFISALIGLIITIAISPLHFVDKVSIAVKQRSELCNLLAIVVAGTLVTYSVAIAGNAETQRQSDIADRETAPLLELVRQANGNKSGYVVKNSKGIASYVSLACYERGWFNLEGEGYEVSVELPVEALDETMHLNKENSQLAFALKSDEVTESSKKAATNKLHSIAPTATSVLFTREILISFFDHNNTQVNLSYTENLDGIRLTSSTFRSYPARNRTIPLQEGAEFAETFALGLSGLLPHAPAA